MPLPVLDAGVGLISGQLILKKLLHCFERRLSHLLLLLLGRVVVLVHDQATDHQNTVRDVPCHHPVVRKLGHRYPSLDVFTQVWSGPQHVGAKFSASQFSFLIAGDWLLQDVRRRCLWRWLLPQGLVHVRIGLVGLLSHEGERHPFQAGPTLQVLHDGWQHARRRLVGAHTGCSCAYGGESDVLYVPQTIGQSQRRLDRFGDGLWSRKLSPFITHRCVNDLPRLQSAPVRHNRLS